MEQKIVLTHNFVTIVTKLDGGVHLKYKDCYLKFIGFPDNIRVNEHYQEDQLEEVKTLTRKEVFNVKSLHPWIKSNLYFF